MAAKFMSQMYTSQRRYLLEKELQLLTNITSKQEKEKAVDNLFLNVLTKNHLKGRLDELGKTWSASKGVCFIEVALELELEKRDMDDALEVADPVQLVKIFPALTKHNAQSLLKTLREKQTDFEGIFAEGKPGIVVIKNSGYGIHCGEGWIITDQRLLQNLTQIQNATFTFIVGDGDDDRKELKFDPVDRMAFHVTIKHSTAKNLSGNHPNLAFVKLGIQNEQGRNKTLIEEWEKNEQKLLDDENLPEFRIPLFNDLDLTKKFSIVEVMRNDDGTCQKITSFVENRDIAPATKVLPDGNIFVKMKVNRLSDYMPKSGGLVFSMDESIFSFCGFIYSMDDGLLVDEERDNPPLTEFLPVHGDILNLFTNAKNFLYNRAGQSLTEGSPISYNYQMMAEFQKDLLVQCLGDTFSIQFIYPYLNETFNVANTIDVSGYFEKETKKN